MSDRFSDPVAIIRHLEDKSAFGGCPTPADFDQGGLEQDIEDYAKLGSDAEREAHIEGLVDSLIAVQPDFAEWRDEALVSWERYYDAKVQVQEKVL